MNPKKRTWVDPPQGWMYGFPKVYDPDRDGEFQDWLRSNGVPEDAEYLRLWEAQEGDE